MPEYYSPSAWAVLQRHRRRRIWTSVTWAVGGEVFIGAMWLVLRAHGG